jgi:hypothetical protein
MEVRRAAVDCFSSIFQAFVPESLAEMDEGPARNAKALEAQQAAVPILTPVLGAFLEVARQYANEWYEGSQDKDWRPDYVLVRRSVSTIGDAAVAVGKRDIQQYFHQRDPMVIFLTNMENSCWEENHEKDDSEDADQSFKDFVLNALP